MVHWPQAFGINGSFPQSQRLVFCGKAPLRTIHRLHIRIRLMSKVKSESVGRVKDEGGLEIDHFVDEENGQIVSWAKGAILGS